MKAANTIIEPERQQEIKDYWLKHKSTFPELQQKFGISGHWVRKLTNEALKARIKIIVK